MKGLKMVFPAMFMAAYWMLVALTISFAAPLAHARISRVIVSVDGMSCPFCTFDVEKRLKKVDGTGFVNVDLKTGTATLLAAEGKTIHLDQIPDAIKTAGCPSVRVFSASANPALLDRVCCLLNTWKEKMLCTNLLRLVYLL